MINKKQQAELDKIENNILILLFGSKYIPESTAIIFKMFDINPNTYIQLFEKNLVLIMDEEGYVNGHKLIQLLKFSKFNEILNVLDIPSYPFLLSNNISNYIAKLIPGVTL